MDIETELSLREVFGYLVNKYTQMPPRGYMVGCR